MNIRTRLDADLYGTENYVCPRCFYQLKDCTCTAFPPYYLIMIDEKMQDTIRTLNSKGYNTIGCCESHYNYMSPSLHVIFNRKYDFEIPEGFKYIKNGNGIAHEYNQRLTKEEWEEEKKKYLKTLNEWAKNLPELDKRKRER